MMEIISPSTEVTQAFNSLPLRFKMHETNSNAARSLSTSPSPSPPGLESVHTGREDSLSTCGSPNYPKASSASTIPYPSPPVLPPLDLSSLPTSPDKDSSVGETIRLKRPASAEVPQNRCYMKHTALLSQKSSPESPIPNSTRRHSANFSMTKSKDRDEPTTEVRRPVVDPDACTKDTPPFPEASQSLSASDRREQHLQEQMTDWNHLLQNFTNFCQGKISAPGASCIKRPRSDADTETDTNRLPAADTLSQFQTMLLNMGQMLFTSQSDTVPNTPKTASAAKSADETNDLTDKHLDNLGSVTQSDISPTSSSVVPSYPTIEVTGTTKSHSNESSANELPVVGISSFVTPSTGPSSTEFPMVPQSSLAFTASLLAMLAAQNANINQNKSVHSPLITNEANSFVAGANMLLPNPFAPVAVSSGQSTPGNSVSINPFPHTRVPPLFTNNATNSCNFPFFTPNVPPNKFTGLPDNRELLYHLGQQLMAMAASSGTPPELSAKTPAGPWTPTHNTSGGNNSNNNSSNNNNNNNCTNPVADSHPLPDFPPPTGPFMSNPMAVMIGSGLFGTQPFPLSSTPVNASVSNPVPVTMPQSVQGSGVANDRKSMGMISNSLLDKTLHPGCLPGAGGSLSGISMRGNQKYSAYYQHQRKQGFHQMNTNTMDYSATGSSGRRQGTPVTTPLSGSRYASRRFRGNLANSGLPTHGMSLDTRGTATNVAGPGNSRCPSGVRAPGSAMFPGFRSSGPYGNGNGPASVPSAVSITPTTTHNTVVKHTLPNGGSSTRLPPTASDSIQYVAASGCTSTTSVSTLSTTGASETTTTRHRDTAFLCSCGQDFESLYVFTLHMKDTGHKPKSDQSERDIPKLVRGQDMWINSETEQTREILRCMRCHQSFRNLPELTMHMMKTNHYSEIVYNDSGRLVFVNPDDPHHPHSRRGSANSGITASGASPGKPSGMSGTPGHWLGRRGSRGLSLNATTTATTTTTTTTATTGSAQVPAIHANQSAFSESQPAGSKCHPNRSIESGVQLKSDPSGESTMGSCDFRATKESGSNEHGVHISTEVNKTHNPEGGSQVLSVGSPHSSGRQSVDDPISASNVATERDSPLSSASTKQENMKCPSDRAEGVPDSPPEQKNKETNVLRQIETFVENNLPRTPKSLSIKVDHGTSNASHRSASSPLATPSTDVSSRYSFGHTVGGTLNSTSDSTKSTPMEHRKRTHSEASLSTHESPVPSPTNDQEKRIKHESEVKTVMSVNCSSGPASNLPLTPNSPGVTSTTSEFSGSLRENPLSSLQKLVETTHKPVSPSAAFSTPTGVTASGCYPLTSGAPTSLFVSCNGSGSTKSGTHCTNIATTNNGRISHLNGGNSSGSSSGPRSLGSPVDTTSNSPFAPTTSNPSHSPGSQFAPIVLPATETENIIPALSALYAYVEKSSTTSTSNAISSTAMQSTTCQQQHSRQPQEVSMPNDRRKPDCMSPYTGDEKTNHADQPISQTVLPQQSPNFAADKLAPNPTLQAIYAAAMSTLATQYLATQQGSIRPSTSQNPLQAFKQAACSFQAMLGDTKSASFDPNWMKMFQLFTGKPLKPGAEQADENDFSEPIGTPGTPEGEIKQKDQSMESDRPHSLTLVQSQNAASNSKVVPESSTENEETGTIEINSNSGNRTSSELANNSASVMKNTTDNNSDMYYTTGSSGFRHTGDTNMGAGGNNNSIGEARISILTSESNKAIDRNNPVHSTPSPSKSISNMDTCSYSGVSHMNTRSLYSNSPNSYHPHLPGILPSRFPSMQNRPMPTTAQSPALMTTMITKKAKCHYCGKPFANKGQVRLHISKNKCPCLLQQSCHVAALAAAFGSDSRPLANANPIPSKSFIKDPLMNSKARSSAEEFLASLSYPTTGSNATLPGDSADSAPSALSLLKERFQNFDLSQSPLRTINRSTAPNTESKTGCSLYNSIAKSSESDAMFPTAASTSYASPFVQPVQSQSPNVQCGEVTSLPSVSWPFGAPPSLPVPFTAAPGTLTSSTGGANNAAAAAAAANAGHLAAMALLAQTLVQLTSSQNVPSASPFRGGPGVVPSLTATQDSFADPTAITVAATAAAAAAAAAAQAAQVSSRSVSTPTSSTAPSLVNPLPPSAFLNSASAFNLDLLMNQTALMKQLAAMTNWPDPNIGGHRPEEESSQIPNPFMALSNCRNTTPNGL
ncbi:Protein tiptop [Fasciolopsis buskii]|uniref:Protein tiptop n=1 Tax=Fasciolopsis buskii TaxID=27845 RepID=A0A8E0VIT4_9TREM|nr:Protein tiptop [Fasciolopsis buski]